MLQALADTLEIIRDERDTARTTLATLKAQAEAFEARMIDVPAGTVTALFISRRVKL